jgi:hypothetical protein
MYRYAAAPKSGTMNQAGWRLPPKCSVGKDPGDGEETVNTEGIERTLEGRGAGLSDDAQ